MVKIKIFIITAALRIQVSKMSQILQGTIHKTNQSENKDDGNNNQGQANKSLPFQSSQDLCDANQVGTDNASNASRINNALCSAQSSDFAIKVRRL